MGRSGERWEVIGGMDSAGFEKVQTLFAALKGLPLGERAEELARHQPVEKAILEEVESLLSYHDRGTPQDDVLEQGAESLLPEASIVGLQVSHYRFLSLLGRGGQATVYEAEDTRSKRRVAVKVLPGQGRAPATIRRLRREAEVVTRLDHPAICPVYEVGEERGVHFIVMQLVVGASLAQLLRIRDEMAEDRTADGPVELPEPLSRFDAFLQAFEKIAEALHCVHEAGIVHRDLKPENIIITDHGDPVLLDFGLAADSEASTQLTRTGQPMGTPAYMAPEQVRGQHREVGAATDIYALGVTLYECVTGRRPFLEDEREMLFRAIRRVRPPRADSVCPAVRGDLSIVLERMLEKQPADRLPSAKQVAEELQRIREGKPIVTRPLRSWDRWRRRARAHPVPTVLLALGLVVGGTWAGWRFYPRASLPSVDAYERVTELEQKAQKLDGQRPIWTWWQHQDARDLLGESDALSEELSECRAALRAGRSWSTPQSPWGRLEGLVEAWDRLELIRPRLHSAVDQLPPGRLIELGAAIRRVEHIEDYDGDGVSDFAVQVTRPRSIQVRSGATGSRLLHIPEPAGQELFGTRMEFGGDLDGDGVGDVLVTSDTQPARRSVGVVVAYCGETGDELYTLRGRGGDGNFGGQLEVLGDLTGDGCDDFAVAARNDGYVHLYSGVDGMLIRDVLIEGDPITDRGIEQLVRVPDWDGDGHDELLVLSMFGGRIHLYSGADPSKRREFVGRWTDCSEHVEVIEDADGDGHPDLAVGASRAGEAKEGAVYLVSGKDGREIRRLTGPADVGLFGLELRAEDLDGDGRQELLVRGFTPLDKLNKGKAVLVCVDLMTGEARWILKGAVILHFDTRLEPDRGCAQLVVGQGGRWGAWPDKVLVLEFPHTP